MLSPFERGLVAHLVADWLLQNDWMAVHKGNLRHPAGWVHAFIHFILLSWALGPLGGLVLAVVHLVVDTGWPLNWWLRAVKKCGNSPHFEMIRFWTDQVVHIAAIAAWVQFGPK